MTVPAAEAIRLIDEGLTGAEVARRFGVTRERIRQLYARERGRSLPPKRFCLRGHPFTEANSLVKSNGYRECRTCRREAYRMRREANRPPDWRPPRHLSQSDIERAIAWYRNGLGYQAIGRRLGFDHSSIRRHILAAGLTPHSTGRIPRRLIKEVAALSLDGPR